MKIRIRHSIASVPSSDIQPVTSNLRAQACARCAGHGAEDLLSFTVWPYLCRALVNPVPQHQLTVEWLSGPPSVATAGLRQGLVWDNPSDPGGAAFQRQRAASQREQVRVTPAVPVGSVFACSQPSVPYCCACSVIN